MPPRLVKALESRNLEQATDIQAKAIPLVQSGSDLFVDAETGSGKTFAYLLPLFARLMDWQGAPKSMALILVPTRELAQQVHKICDQFASIIHARSVVLTGGQELKFQAALLRKIPEILIATPGRLRELLEKGQAELGEIEYLVLDEADRMLDMGFRDDVLTLVESCPPERQGILLSATLNHGGVSSIARGILKEPKKISLSESRGAQQNIQHQILLADDQEHKLKLVNAILAEQQGQVGKVLIFANKRLRVDKITQLLGNQYRVNKLHGEMSQDERNRIMNLYRNGAIDVLVATDLAARGLDVEEVTLVINYDMAHSGNDYIHRVGRTGRAGNQGRAISLIASYEWNLSESVQRYLKTRFETIGLPGLKAKFKGPKKSKNKISRKKTVRANSTEAQTKTKVRKRDQKNIGKRRKPSAPALGDGLAPLKRS